MSNRPLRLTLSKIDLLISCQNLLPHGDPILVDPSSILPGGQATNLESPLTPLLPLILSVSKSHSLCLQILPRTRPLLINSTAITTISHLDYCRSLFSPSSVLFTRARGILLTSTSQPVTPLLTTLSWLLFSLSVKVLTGSQKGSLHLAPIASLFSSPPTVPLLPPVLPLPSTCPAPSSLRTFHPGCFLCLDHCSPGRHKPDFFTSFRSLLKCHLLSDHSPQTTLSKRTPSLLHFLP